MNEPHVFTGNPLDHAERQRRDRQWLAAQASAATSRFLPFWRLKVLVSGGDQATLGWVGIGELHRLGSESEPVFLGLREGVSHFAIDLTELTDAADGLDFVEPARFEEVRSAATALSPADAAIVAQARAQVDWHARHGFCSVCGERTQPARGGQMRRCPACRAQHFPRTDPVVIVVVSEHDRCLLGQSRGRLSRMGMYSALAGFVDQGESIEEAVRREVREEAGVEVGNVRYHSSQPWPFPSSLMIGCHADARSTEVRPDREEMADVRWFERQQVLLALEGDNPNLTLPGPIAIAHHLIKAWAKGEA